MRLVTLRAGALSDVAVRFYPIVACSLIAFGAIVFAGAGAAFAEGDAACLKCHADPALKRADGGALAVDVGRLAASLHAKAHIGCVDCHVDLADIDIDPALHARKNARKVAPVACVACHEEAVAKHHFHPQMAAKPDQVTCQECHGGHDLVATKDPAFKFSRARQAVACGACHELMRDEFAESAHGQALVTGAVEPPDCLKCHQSPLVNAASGAQPIVLKQEQARVCLGCHLDSAAVRARIAPSAGFIAAFEQSVHGRALATGNDKAPTCSNCHGGHAIKRGRDSTSSVNRANVAETCAECHTDVGKKFKGSIHAAALAKGSGDAPTCTTCHGEHDILKHNDPRAPVAAANVSIKVCAPCHGSLKLSRKYGIRGDRFETFERSYHGLAMKGGDVEVANCASCHGIHDIKPSSDPTSRVHKDHLVETCGKCHTGANQNFTNGLVHLTMARTSDPTLYWLSTLYLILVVTVVSGMVVHNLLDFVKRARRRFAARTGDVHHPPPAHRLYLRMSASERWQHAALGLSFCALVFTGFLLRYPDAWWVLWIRGSFGRLFLLRGPTHRVAGVVMLAASVVHIWYIAFTPRGRSLVRDLWPRRSDLTDAFGVLAYNLGMRADKPRFGRFSYVEKVEYWALIWGTIVMATTGLIMWFDNSSMRVLTKHGYEIARLIHFFEAWLATLSILCWHLYFVAFNPDSYPMSLAWLTGTVPEQEMEEEHPLELERIKAAEAASAAASAASAAAVDPPPPPGPPGPKTK